MANELPEVIPIPAALIPEGSALSGEDLIFILQGGHFRKLPATEFKGDRGDAATGLFVGAWKVATFKRVGGSHRSNVVYRLIKSAGELVWVEFAGTMDVFVTENMNYSYQQETVDDELANSACSAQHYLIHDNNWDNFTGRLAVSMLSDGKLVLAINDGGSYPFSNLLWSLDGILYNIREELPSVTPPENASIVIDVTTTNVPNTAESFLVTVETMGGGWVVDSKPSWLSLSQSSGDSGQSIVTVFHTVNTNMSSRNGAVVFKHAVESTLTATLQVTQAAAPQNTTLYADVNLLLTSTSSHQIWTAQNISFYTEPRDNYEGARDTYTLPSQVRFKIHSYTTLGVNLSAGSQDYQLTGDITYDGNVDTLEVEVSKLPDGFNTLHCYLLFSHGTGTNVVEVIGTL
ncbi:MAG: hypothetical protein LBU42_03285 [Prevotellaceae bacterium]|jgi:hypothetical protein|nr:hypothetical protein [Prevotellaceae bacterium]